jgi:hypothetical protein
MWESLADDRETRYMFDENASDRNLIFNEVRVGRRNAHFLGLERTGYAVTALFHAGFRLTFFQSAARRLH